MIDVLITVGRLKESPITSKCVQTKLPYLPNIGDIIFPNIIELSTMLDEYCDKWNLPRNSKINHVISVGHSCGCNRPVIMLNKSHNDVYVDLFYNNKVVSMLVDQHIRYEINDMIFDSRLCKDYLYIHSITKRNRDYFFILGEKPCTKMPVDVNIINYELKITPSRVLDVNITNRDLKVSASNLLPVIVKNDILDVWVQHD